MTHAVNLYDRVGRFESNGGFPNEHALPPRVMR